MARRFFSSYRYDIPFEEGAGAGVVAAISGLMIFFVFLSLALNFILSGRAASWERHLASAVTVEIRAPLLRDEKTGAPGGVDRAKLKKEQGQMISFLQERPDVLSVSPVGDEEIENLIEPWLGRKAPLDVIPLPALIDVRLKEGADPAILSDAVTQFMPQARLDTHADMLRGAQGFAATLRLFSVLLTGVIGALAVVAIAGTVRAQMAVHRADVEILHQVGASDSYIARQFRRHALGGTFCGALIGTAAAIAALCGVAALTGTLETLLLPSFSGDPAAWALLSSAPLLVGLALAAFSAQTTVLSGLNRMD